MRSIHFWVDFDNHCGFAIEDFFPTINFGRVRGMFMGKPYLRNNTVASILAQICCYDNSLPQGAPTSPVISNMICAKMDSDLIKLAKAHKCTYSRYADDMTFSSFNPSFPLALAATNSVGQIDVGSELLGTINRNGFSINHAKVRLQTRNRRQEVTGLVVNKFTNVDRKFIRQIRAMIHDWKENGHVVAEQRFFKDFDKKPRKYDPDVEVFKYVVRGKVDFLGQVRGKKDFIYLRFCRQLKELDPELMKNYPDEPSVSKEDIEAQQTLLATYRRNVVTLLQQVAYAGGIFVPLTVTNELQGAREEIQRRKQILRGWNVPVADHPDDTEHKR
jgi:RNA-directed DNA polymerase